MLNKLLIMFAFTMFTSNETIKDLDKKFNAVRTAKDLYPVPPKIVDLDRAKASGFNCFSEGCIYSILPSEKQLNRESFRVGPNSQFLAARGIAHNQEFARFAHNNPCVLDAYARFENALRGSNLSEKEISTILDAVVFAAEKHQFQTRKNATHVPYIIHPIGVAYNILTIAKVSDPKILTAAVLHDTVEDTDTTFVEIRQRYGPEVESYVQELTDETDLPKQVRKDLQVINASHKSKGAAYIKLADKLYNLTDLSTGLPEDWTPERGDEYFRWAKQVVDQLPPVSPELKSAIEQIVNLYWSQKLPLNDQPGP